MRNVRDQPLVSVVIPTYNRANLLTRALRSVINQSYPNLEILVIDDGSTDDTAKVVNKFIKQDDRIKYFYQENFGARARPVNLGIKQSNGEYVAFLDSDDEYLPWKIELQVKKFRQRNDAAIGLVGTDGYIVRDSDNKIVGKFVNPRPRDVFQHLLRGRDILCPAVMINREVFDNVGLFDERMTCYEDLDFYLRALEAGYHFEFVQKPSYKYYVHRGNINLTTRPIKRAHDYERVLKKHQNSYRDYGYLDDMIFYVGLMYVLANDFEKATKYFQQLRMWNNTRTKGYLGHLILKILSNKPAFHLMNTCFQYYSQHFFFLDRKLIKL